MKNNLADPISYKNYSIRRFISPQTKKTLWVAMPKDAKYFVSSVHELDLIKELIDEVYEGEKRD